MCLIDTNVEVERIRGILIRRTNNVERVKHRNHLLSEKKKLVVKDLSSNSNSELGKPSDDSK